MLQEGGKRQRPAAVTESSEGRKNQSPRYTTQPIFKVNQRHLTANIHLAGKQVTAIVDTGATRSFVSRTFLENLGPSARTVSTRVNVRLADGTTLRVGTALMAKVQVGTRAFSFEFLVLPAAMDTVTLGMDFLAETKTKITCDGRSTEFSDESGSNRHGEDTLGTIHEANEEPDIASFLAAELKQFETMSGVTNVASHRINMRDDTPVKQRYYPKNPAMQAVINKQVDELLKLNCIEPSKSAYSSPIVLVRKKTGEWRMCVDYRQVNAKSITDAYPLPRINHILEKLREARYISTIDLKNGYWQIPVEPNSRKYTAFTVPGRGLFQWRVMPFGLHSAPATFQRALDNVIGQEMEPNVFAYLDDIVVVSRTIEDHKRHLANVFNRLRQANLRINQDKCQFFKRELRYLGHLITPAGIRTDPDKVAAIKELKAPTNVKELRRCLGTASWYRRFVPEFSRIAFPLTSMLKKGKRWQWGPEQQQSFEELKEKLTEAPVLACPDFTRQFILQTDASDIGLGAVLTQEQEGGERVISYASRHLQGAEKNYSATEKECLAIVWAVRKMRPYLEGYHFKIITDHLALKWLNSIDNPSGRIARWALELQQHSFEIQYRKGKYNVVADTLSRQPRETTEVLRTLDAAEGACDWVEATKAKIIKEPRKYPDYMIENGVLYRHIPREIGDEEEEPWKLCVGRPDRRRVLAENHDAASAGHLGVRKTILRVARLYYWPGMFRDVARYVRNCDSCQRFKAEQRRPAGEMLTRIPEEPWSTVCADFVGPLPRSRRGFNMLLVFLDKFTKWVEIVPLRKATTSTLQQAFRERIVARFGVPKVFLTDNGVQFTSNQFRKYLRNLGVRQQYTAPYTPRENPTERANRTIKTIISQFTGADQRNWDELLPEITLAINSSTSSATGYSPSYLVQGRQPRLPRNLFDETTLGTGQQTTEPSQRSDQLKEIFKIARRNLAVAAADQARHYNLRRRSWAPQIGELVLVRAHHLSKASENFASKLAPKYNGPFPVLNFVSPGIVTLGSPSRKTKAAHIGDLKPYHAGEQQSTRGD